MVVPTPLHDTESVAANAHCVRCRYSRCNLLRSPVFAELVAGLKSKMFPVCSGTLAAFHEPPSRLFRSGIRDMGQSNRFCDSPLMLFRVGHDFNG